jgi:hypothetical protein
VIIHDNAHEEEKVRRLEILYSFTAGASLMGLAVIILLISTRGLSCTGI